MATYSSYFPASPIGKAMFNFDESGTPNYRLVGTVRVSTSDSFSFDDYLLFNYSNFFRDLYSSSLYTSEFDWSTQRIANVQEILGIYHAFANINFTWQGDYDFAGFDTTVNPEDVGRANLADINITWTYRPDVRWDGISGGSADRSVFYYVGGAGDIFLNDASPSFDGDSSLGLSTRARQVLMHELGHSFGLSHPHRFIANGVPVLSGDYAATVSLGFEALGFAINSEWDMYKEYFTIMSYDDQLSVLPGYSVTSHAHTPMILDVIALQEAYGEGAGTSGVGNDTISAGPFGYRTYFDKGGNDTIDMSSYTDGAYLNMGVPIYGAPHLVGVGMSRNDAERTVLEGGSPAHLRWFYGEFENANGSPYGDLLIGNSMANSISGLAGDDFIIGGGGNDTIDGGAGIDSYNFTGIRSQYILTKTPTGYRAQDGVSGRDGADLVAAVETLTFADSTVDLTMALKAAGISGSVLKTLQELYVGFFNRIPEAAGLGYWIGQIQQGVTLRSVADQFYGAGVQFGVFSATMTEAQFITVVYANVLGRTGANGPTPGDILYWQGWLHTGTNSKGAMVLQMLGDSHSIFTGHPEVGWVVDLLDNKAEVANYFAVLQGMSYTDPQTNIAKGIEVAAAITPTDTSAALALIGVNEFAMS